MDLPFVCRGLRGGLPIIDIMDLDAVYMSANLSGDRSFPPAFGLGTGGCSMSVFSRVFPLISWTLMDHCINYCDFT